MSADSDWSLPAFSALILDLDGLVIDSEPSYRAAWIAAGLEFSYPLRIELVEGFVGKSHDAIEQILVAEFGPDFPMAAFRERAAKAWHEAVEASGIPVKPGLPKLLRTLSDLEIPFCLATNSERKYAEKCLGYAGLEQAFPIRITRDQVDSPKPSPDIFVAAAARLNAKPGDCIVLEDSETGIRAALSAQTQPILVGEPEILPPSIRAQILTALPSLGEFERLLRRL